MAAAAGRAEPAVHDDDVGHRVPAEEGGVERHAGQGRHQRELREPLGVLQRGHVPTPFDHPLLGVLEEAPVRLPVEERQHGPQGVVVGAAEHELDLLVAEAALADSIQATLKGRRVIEIERSKPYVVVRQVTIISLITLAGVYLLSPGFFEPYRTPLGQFSSISDCALARWALSAGQLGEAAGFAAHASSEACSDGRLANTVSQRSAMSFGDDAAGGELLVTVTAKTSEPGGIAKDRDRIQLRR